VLRFAVLGCAVLLTLGGAGLCAAGFARPGANLLGIGLLVLLGVWIERWRYRKEPRPDAQWQPNGERFVDPATGERIDVLYDARTGERRYKRESENGAARR